MENITLPIYNTQGKEIDSAKLDSAVFDGSINKAVLYQAVGAYMANQRRGLAATKTRGEVSGGGRKPWKQKGTGRARVGSTRSPLWRHGGVIFGPHPRDFSYLLPKKIKNLALKSAFNVKIKENNFIVLDGLKAQTNKTKDMLKIFSDLKLTSAKNKKINTVLLLADKIDDNLRLGLRNIDFLTFCLAREANAYGVLAAHKIVITKDGLSEITKRLKK